MPQMVSIHYNSLQMKDYGVPKTTERRNRHFVNGYNGALHLPK